MQKQAANSEISRGRNEELLSLESWSPLYQWLTLIKVMILSSTSIEFLLVHLLISNQTKNL
jgi:hypothetical protein